MRRCHGEGWRGTPSTVEGPQFSIFPRRLFLCGLIKKRLMNYDIGRKATSPSSQNLHKGPFKWYVRPLGKGGDLPNLSRNFSYQKSEKRGEGGLKVAKFRRTYYLNDP